MVTAIGALILVRFESVKDPEEQVPAETLH